MKSCWLGLLGLPGGRAAAGSSLALRCPYALGNRAERQRVHGERALAQHAPRAFSLTVNGGTESCYSGRHLLATFLYVAHSSCSLYLSYLVLMYRVLMQRWYALHGRTACHAHCQTHRGSTVRSRQDV